MSDDQRRLDELFTEWKANGGVLDRHTRGGHQMWRIGKKLVRVSIPHGPSVDPHWWKNMEGEIRRAIRQYHKELDQAGITAPTVAAKMHAGGQSSKMEFHMPQELASESPVATMQEESPSMSSLPTRMMTIPENSIIAVESVPSLVELPVVPPRTSNSYEITSTHIGPIREPRTDGSEAESPTISSRKVDDIMATTGGRLSCPYCTEKYHHAKHVGLHVKYAHPEKRFEYLTTYVGKTAQKHYNMKQIKSESEHAAAKASKRDSATAASASKPVTKCPYCGRRDVHSTACKRKYLSLKGASVATQAAKATEKKKSVMIDLDKKTTTSPPRMTIDSDRVAVNYSSSLRDLEANIDVISEKLLGLKNSLNNVRGVYQRLATLEEENKKLRARASSFDELKARIANLQ